MIIHSEHTMLQLCNMGLTEILLFMGPEIWSLFPSNINNSETLEIFKQKISYWTPDNSFFKLTLKALDIYKAIAFLSGFVLKKLLPQIMKVFFFFLFYHYFIVVDLY